MKGLVDREAWQSAFDELIANPDKGRNAALVPWARRSRCLPIHWDWTHVFGVNVNGDILAWGFDDPWPGVAEIPPGLVSDARLVNLAIHQGKALYPWLESLATPRPCDAQTCSMCDGKGTLPPPMICYCGGAGWVPAHDTWVNTDRFRPPSRAR